MTSGTIVVWVLVGFLGAYYKGGPIVIDNIASQQNCEAVRELVLSTHRNEPGDAFRGSGPTWARCIQVRQAAP